MKKRFRLRIIIPAFPSFNIYTGIARKTTAYGPVCVATSANKLDLWDVEVIDENNCASRFCPKDANGMPDHHRLQEIRPADVVGFYGSLSSTIPRLFQISNLYKQMGVTTVAGGKHVENLPEEALANHIDVVVFGEGEDTIKEILLAHQEKCLWNDIQGIAFLHQGGIVKTPDRPEITDFDVYPFPDFNLVWYAKIRIFPLSRNRGCDMNCEFCAVKDRSRCSTPRRMLAQIAYLVETCNARKFFESSDHFATNREDTIEFCRLLAEYQKQNGVRLKLIVQVRLNDAAHPELLSAMRDAGIYTVCIGYESPIDEELKAMRKGYRSKDMLAWTKIYHDYGFFIHGMFMFGYPWRKGHGSEEKQVMPVQERADRFRQFIRKGRIDTAQVLMTVPLPGTELRERLEQDGRLYPLDKIGWEYYDGQYPLFEPDDGSNPEELQRAVGSIMSGFYSLNNFWRVVINIGFRFPTIVFPAALTLTTLRTRYLSAAFKWWNKQYFRNQATRFAGYFIVRNWFKKFRSDDFLEKLEEARTQLANQANSHEDDIRI